MWLRVSLPDFGPAKALVRLETVYKAVGERIQSGESLCDLLVDLSDGVVRDCPPISTSRIFLREPVWLRSIETTADALLESSALIALLSTDPEEPPQPPLREARVSVATMLHHTDWWTYGT